MNERSEVEVTKVAAPFFQCYAVLVLTVRCIDVVVNRCRMYCIFGLWNFKLIFSTTNSSRIDPLCWPKVIVVRRSTISRTLRLAAVFWPSPQIFVCICFRKRFTQTQCLRHSIISRSNPEVTILTLNYSSF